MNACTGTCPLKAAFRFTRAGSAESGLTCTYMRILPRGALQGMMGIGLCGDDDIKGAFELHFLYVDPGCVRMGIGSEMLRFFEEKAGEKCCGEYVIWVLEENRNARNFYEKHGYRPDGKEKIFRRWNKREIRYVKTPAAGKI